MNHKPFETWMVAGEPLSPAQEISLQEHLETCNACRQLQTSWKEVENILGGASFAQPRPGFTARFQARLAEEISRAQAKEQMRSTWMFMAASSGAALLILIIMSIRYFSSVQNSTHFFVSGMTLIAGMLNLTEAIQAAFVPLVEVVFVSVPVHWWLFVVVGACLITLALTFSTLRILYARRVSL